MLNYHAVKNWNFAPVIQTYTERDSMLYALGLNIGADPADRGQLRYVYEKDLKTLPTMATVLGSPGFWWRDPKTGTDWVRLVHGEQSVRVRRPLPAAGVIVAENRVVSITDKGAGKGAIVVIERRIKDQSSGELLAEVVHGTFLRGDGGYSEGAAQSDPGPPALPPPPVGAPALEVELATLPQQALIALERGLQHPARRPGHRKRSRIRAADLARPMHLWNGRARGAARRHRL